MKYPRLRRGIFIFESNRREITLCTATKRYGKEVMGKHFDPAKLPPITKWKDDRQKLTAEKQQLNTECQKLKSDTLQAEKSVAGL